MASCGENSVQETEIIPNEWIGDDQNFQSDFEIKADGNRTILIHRKSAIPFIGKVERNGTKFHTMQSFDGGLLDGISIKKSKDGSWVEANYKNGKLHGEMTFYGKNKNKRSVLNFSYGVLIKKTNL